MLPKKSAAMKQAFKNLNITDGSLQSQSTSISRKKSNVIAPREKKRLCKVLGKLILLAKTIIGNKKTVEYQQQLSEAKSVNELIILTQNLITEVRANIRLIYLNEENHTDNNVNGSFLLFQEMQRKVVAYFEKFFESYSDYAPYILTTAPLFTDLDAAYSLGPLGDGDSDNETKVSTDEEIRIQSPIPKL